MVYDCVELANNANDILVVECRKRTISPILNFISRNKVDRFKVRLFFLYLTTYWYHLTVGVCRYVIMMDNIMCK